MGQQANAERDGIAASRLGSGDSDSTTSGGSSGSGSSGEEANGQDRIRFEAPLGPPDAVEEKGHSLRGRNDDCGGLGGMIDSPDSFRSPPSIPEPYEEEWDGLLSPQLDPDATQDAQADDDLMPPSDAVHPASSAAAATAASASPATPVAPYEENDPADFYWDVSIPHFAEVRRKHFLNPQFKVEWPLQTTDGHELKLQVHPAYVENERGVGAYLFNSSWTTVHLAFRFVAFAPSVVDMARAAAAAADPPTDDFCSYLPHNHPHNRTLECDFTPLGSRCTLGWGNLLRPAQFPKFLTAPDDSLHIRVLIQMGNPKPPPGVSMRTLKSFISYQSEAKKKWPYVGLNNQGATCYMNSYLQTLFHLPLVRSAVYNIPISSEQMQSLLSHDPSSTAVSSSEITLRSPSPLSAESAAVTSIAAALQRLLYMMQTEGDSIGTRVLTRSFGWDTRESFQQHDVQEFSRKLMENLEDASKKQTPPLPPVTRFFEGRQEMFIQCKHIAYKSSRVEPFLDLSLNVLGHPTLRASLADYVATESMEGENQYHAKSDDVDHGKQDATKGIRILQFPPVLQLQLKRFTYNMQTDRMEKVHSRFEFPEVIDLSEFESGEADEQPPTEGEEKSNAASSSSSAPPLKAKASAFADPAIYHLHSVLVHRGNIGGGHYWVFVKPFLAGEGVRYEESPWLKFDDETVSICASSAEAVDKSFGGKHKTSVKILGKTIEREEQLEASAYMLIYCRQSVVRAKGLEVAAPLPSIASPTPILPLMQNGHAAVNGIKSEPQDAEMTDDEAAPVLPLARAPTLPSLSIAMEIDSASSTVPVDGAAAIIPAELPSALPRHFTDSPVDVDVFITSLSPVAVPLPSHISEGIAEAQRVRDAKEKERMRQATLFNLDVILEKDLLFQGLRVDGTPGLAGVAGLELRVAPAVTEGIALPLDQFIYQRPSHSIEYKRTDTISTIRDDLATRFGIPPERQQLWCVTADKPTRLLPDDCKLININQVARPNNDFVSTRTIATVTTVFLRDTHDVDQQEQFRSLTGGAGFPSADAIAKASPSRLLLLKFFDAHTQRLYYLGSVVVFAETSMSEFKAFVVALAKSRGLDIEQRFAARKQKIDQMLATESATQPSVRVEPPIKVEPPASSSSSAAPNGAEAPTAPPAAATPMPLPDPFTYPRPESKPLPEVDCEARDVDEEEARWAHYQKSAAEKSAAAPPTPAPAAAAYDPFVAPLRIWTEANCTNVPLPPPVPEIIKPSSGYVGQLLAKQPAPAPEDLLPPFRVPCDLHAANIRDAKWTDGTILVVTELLTVDAKRWLAKQLESEQLATKPPWVTSAAAAVAAAGASPLRKRKKPAAKALAAAAAAIAADPLKPFSSILSALPPPSAWQLTAGDLLDRLRNRILITFHPVALDHTTMETTLLDPVRHPLHPLIGVAPVTLELTPINFTRNMRSKLADSVASQVLPSTRLMYPQLADVFHYKIWRQTRQVATLQPDIGPGPLSIRQTGNTFDTGIASALSYDSAVATIQAHNRLNKPFVFFYEISAVSLKVLADHWWLNVDFVDSHGGLHRAPSRYPGLVQFEPFLVPKEKTNDKMTDMAAVSRRLVRDWLAPHQAPLGLKGHQFAVGDQLIAHPTTPEIKVKRPVVKTEADLDTIMSEADVNSKKRDHSPNSEHADSSSSPAAKKVKLENGDALAVTVGAPPLPTIRDTDVAHLFYTPLPLVDRTNSWLLFPSLPGPLALYSHQYSAESPVTEILDLLVSQWFQETAIRRGAPAASVLASGKNTPALFPLSFSSSKTPHYSYAQPVPLPITFYHVPTPVYHVPTSAPDVTLRVMRFTTISPLPQKSNYSFSPLPPILLGVSRDDTLATVRERLVHLLGLPPAALTLAVVRARQYELAPADASDEAVRFMHEIMEDALECQFRVALGLWDSDTRHDRSTSATHILAKEGHQAQRRPAAGSLTLGGKL